MIYSKVPQDVFDFQQFDNLNSHLHNTRQNKERKVKSYEKEKERKDKGGGGGEKEDYFGVEPFVSKKDSEYRCNQKANRSAKQSTSISKLYTLR